MANVLEDVETYIRRYIALPNEAEYKVLAAYVIHTWCPDVSETTPYLYIYSGDPGSGKTTLMETIASLSDSPVLTANLTAPTLMNLVDSEDHLTLYYDEIDTLFASNSASNKQMQGVLNSGYRKGGSAYRVKGDGVRKINVYCPKVMAGLHNGELPSTLVDRAIPVQLRRKRHDQKLEKFVQSKAAEHAAPVWDEIEAWVSQNREALESYEMDDREGWGPRETEIANPLVAIASRFGLADELADTIHAMVTSYKKDLASRDKSLDFLRTIAAIFAMEGNTVFTETVASYMGLPNDNKSAKTIAELADVHGASVDTVRVGNQRRKGYTLIQFANVLDAAGLMRANGTINEDAL